MKAHWSSRLHYDLRLEMDGVAKSWAIPKEPLLVPATRRLAIQVEDHSIEDMDYEDLIKEKAPRSGRVETWDQGTYELFSRNEDQHVLRFQGDKLKGLHGLVRVLLVDNEIFEVFEYQSEADLDSMLISVYLSSLQ